MGMYIGVPGESSVLRLNKMYLGQIIRGCEMEGAAGDEVKLLNRR